jgi:hypothetical protein
MVLKSIVIIVVAVGLIIPSIALSTTYFSVARAETQRWETLATFPTYMECFDAAIEIITNKLKEDALKGYAYVTTIIERPHPSLTSFSALAGQNDKTLSGKMVACSSYDLSKMPNK